MAKLLDLYRTDKLCPKCGQGIEIDREIVCRLCDIKKNAKAQLDFIETGAMYLTHTLGIRRPPPVHKITPPVTKEKKPAQKRTRKPTTKAKTKKG